MCIALLFLDTIVFTGLIVVSFYRLIKGDDWTDMFRVIAILLLLFMYIVSLHNIQIVFG